MGTLEAQSIVIDATHSSASSLRDVLAETFCAAKPEQHAIERVTVFAPTHDITDWPTASWLTVTRDELTQDGLNRIGNDILLSLNHIRFDHPLSIALVCDDEAARADNHTAQGGLLQRLKQKVSSSSNTLEQASALLSMSCFGAAKLKPLGKPQHTVPVGVAPEFFRVPQMQRLVNNADIDNPFMWLSVVCDQNMDTARTIIEAVKVLRSYGGCLELKLLLPPDADDPLLKTLEREYKSASFVEFLCITNKAALVREYHQADAFIWPCRSDRNYTYLLRAMASALPIVAPDSQQIKKHVGEKLRYFHEGDANDLADSLERSMADIHFRILGSGRNHKNAMRHTYENVATQLFTMLRAYGGNHEATTVLAS